MTKRLRSKIAALVVVCLAAGGVATVRGAGRIRLGCTESYRRAADRRRARCQAARPRSVRAGIEIKLDPGWHTYWRDPGDSGVPPKIDFSGSDNVKSVTVLWPAPERFPDGAGGTSIGYLDRVILPLHVTPQNAGKPSSLQLKLGYDICSNMCVPVESDLKLSLNGDGAEEAAIEKAEIRVPQRAATRRRRCPTRQHEGRRRQEPRHSFGASRIRQSARSRRRRSRGADRRGRRSVRRRSDTGLVAAAAGGQRLRRRPDTAVHVRSRWAAARRQGRRARC